MATGHTEDSQLAELMERALQFAEDALEQITRIAVEEIRRGVESSNHIEAAERDMRSALRQLVLAQREWRAKSPARPATADERIAGAPSRIVPAA